LFESRIDGDELDEKLDEDLGSEERLFPKFFFARAKKSGGGPTLELEF